MRYLSVLFFALPLAAGVHRIHVYDRADVLGGRSLGAAGAYERIMARVSFSVDPRLVQNRQIRDIDLAPRNEQGMVEFAADLYVLKPRDPALANGTILFEVSNRGNKGMLGRFQYARGSSDPKSAEEFGDLFLMERGFTLVWLGWQFDVPETPNLMRVYLPVASVAGQAIQGVLRAEFIPNRAATEMPLADRGHKAYPVAADAVSATLRLTVRDTPTGSRQTVPAANWSLDAARTHVHMASGFQVGRIYELVYPAINPPVAGLGFAGVRDLISFLKYGGPETLLADQRRFQKRAIGFGISQSGRFLRTLLYYGFNEDEKGRKVFDGVWADVAGAGRVFANHRFAQPSRDGNAFLNTLYPTDLYPFTDLAIAAKRGEATDGLLNRATASRVIPRIFYTNGSHEYWGRCASLIHTTPDGKEDAPIAADTRVYSLSGVEHGPRNTPTDSAGSKYYHNPVDFRPIHRALLVAMHAWVKDGTEPPASRYPRVAANVLVPPDKVRFPRVSGVQVPKHPREAYRLDFGPRFDAEGIIEREPPKPGDPYAVMVPQVDLDGIDLGGIRMPTVSVPLGTLLGWNYRAQNMGSHQQLAALIGGFIPFARTATEQAKSQDSRRPLDARYNGRADYLQKIDGASHDLVLAGFMLERDIARVHTMADRLWEFVARAN